MQTDLMVETPTTETVPDSTPTMETTHSTVTAEVTHTTTSYALLPQYASTPKRGARRTKREPQALLAYVLTHGPVLALTPETYAALASAGLPKHRVVNAVSDLKKYFGVPVTAARTGRTVTQYTFTL